MLEIQDLKDFSINSWYALFKDITLKTIILEIPKDVYKWFQLEEISSDSDSDLWDDIEYSSVETQIPLEFEEKIKNAFNILGNTVFVKNNWHAPTDAKMFSVGNTLKTESIEDIKLFLTTSSIILQDFAHFKGIPFCLALRKWINIHPAAEFRCIVINNILRGITPRDWPTFYPHFQEEGAGIIETILEFFNEFIKHKFPRRHYCFDVVLSYPDKPYILDFGPLNNRTELYAFTWKEISLLLRKEVEVEIPPVFRYIESDIGITIKPNVLLTFQQQSN